MACRYALCVGSDYKEREALKSFYLGVSSHHRYSLFIPAPGFFSSRELFLWGSSKNENLCMDVYISLFFSCMEIGFKYKKGRPYEKIFTFVSV